VHTNIDGVRSLLDVCRKGDVRLVHVSTDEVYGPSGRVPFNETSPLNPQNPYAASKASADLLIQSYKNTFGVRSVVIRPSNNFGPGQHTEKFIPTIVSRVLAGRKIPIYGDGKQKRQWTFVKDCAASICDLAENSKREIVNVASGTVHENVQIASKIIEIMGASHDLLQHVTDRPGHDREYWITSHHHVIEKETVFEDALRETVNHTMTRLGSAV
jgi:dTDP-glucose 4,6-dehydratase